MAKVRFNHMELTVPPGTLDDAMRAELTAFYGGVLGWETMDVEIVGGTQFLMRPDEGQFILVAEHAKHMQSPGYDHLGLLCDTRAEVDDLLAACQAWQERRRPAAAQGLRRPRHPQPGGARLLREVPPADLVRRAVHGVEDRGPRRALGAGHPAGLTRAWHRR